MTDKNKTPKPGTIFDYLPMEDIDTDKVQKDIKAQFKRKLPNKFFKLAEYSESKLENQFEVLLDGKPLKTPSKYTLTIPTRALAVAICAEWNALETHINPDHLPLTKTANSALETTAGNMGAIIDELVKFGETDLLIYQQEFPFGLQKQQELHWNPIILWAENMWDVNYEVTYGITHVNQNEIILKHYKIYLSALDTHALSTIYLITTATGSLLIALAYHAGILSVEGLIIAAFVDEDWQLSQWGEDEDAKKIREFKIAEIKSFCDYLDHLKVN